MNSRMGFMVQQVCFPAMCMLLAHCCGQSRSCQGSARASLVSLPAIDALQLLDELLKEEHVMDVIGCLEYDPDLQAPQQAPELFADCCCVQGGGPHHKPGAV